MTTHHASPASLNEPAAPKPAPVASEGADVPTPVEEVGALRSRVADLSYAVERQYVDIERLALRCDRQQHLISRTVDYLNKILDGPLDSTTEMVVKAALSGLDGAK